MGFLRLGIGLWLPAMMLAFLFSEDLCAQANPAPDAPTGWKKSSSSGKIVFTKRDLEDRDHLTVKFYQRSLLVDKTLEQWVASCLVERRAPMGGQWDGPIENLARLTRNIYNAERGFTVDGKKHKIMLTAVCVDKLNVRLSAVTYSQTRGAKKHLAAATQLSTQLLPLEIAAAKAEKRGLDIEKNPPKVSGLKTGLSIKPGRYVGTTVAKKDSKTQTRYDLVLFENGDYQFLSGKKERLSTGQFVYSRANGRIEIDKPFRNDTRDWSDKSLYGKDSRGDWVIHAETKYHLTRLKWVGKSDRPSPTEVRRQAEIDRREAARYPHVTEPGKGIRGQEIERIVYASDTEFRNGAMQQDFEGFLLLKDGRVHDGLPCSPDTMDLAASRSREPDAWGWWKEVETKKETENQSEEKLAQRYTFAWPVRPREYRMPNGTQLAGVAFVKGKRLDGDFGAASTEVIMSAGYSSVRWWGIKLDKNGRFLKYRRGSTQGGGMPGMETLVTTSWNDEGAITSLSGPNVAGGFKRKSQNPVADRMGRYEIDGYRITLTFDNGRVEHLATFTDKDNSFIWFEGRALYRRK